MMGHGGRAAVRGGMLVIVALLGALMPLIAQGASQFASPAFAQQWNRVEPVVPNFWGPLATARDGQTEPYTEGAYNGQAAVRLVQYFDKARMELTTPSGSVTNGLLTVELKSGNLQLGDSRFEQHDPATIGIAGDQDTPGPTYATLHDPSLPERDALRAGTVDLGYNMAAQRIVPVPPASDPAMAFATYQSDPGGRFGQNVPRAFWDFMQRLPPTPGWQVTMGYPIAPAFATNVRVDGVENTVVLVQAFERRVLTYTPRNPDPFKVEFGNIGRHYYAWRYGGAPSSAMPPPALITPDQLAPRFAALLAADKRLRGLLDSPAGMPFQSPSAALEFEHGRMLSFRAGVDVITVLCGDDPQAGQVFVSSRLTPYYEDIWHAGPPTGGGVGPQPGLYEPGGNFGGLWQARADVRACLGYATTADATTYTATVQTFARAGVLLSTPDGQAAYALYLVGQTAPPDGRYERFALPMA